MTIKQIMRLKQETIDKKCRCHCETKDCIFPEYLWKYRQDGFCIKECVSFVDGWIREDEQEIKVNKLKIERLENRIAKYKEFKKKMEEEMR